MAQDWIVTLPQNIEWADYQKELDAVADWSAVMNFRVPYLPRLMEQGDRCYLVWRGQVRGWMAVTGIARWPNGFQCQTTGNVWAPGNYVQRSGPFHPIENGPPMRGFQGIRRFVVP